jgi:hypothetical protein
MMPEVVDTRSATTFATQYEILRMAVLGEPLPPEARSGLLLFLRRGMWGWAQTLAGSSIREEPTPLPSSRPAPRGREAVVHVLAALAIATPDRRVG